MTIDGNKNTLTRTEGSSNVYGIEVAANVKNLKINNLTLERTGLAKGSTAVKIPQGANVNLSMDNCEISGFEFGIYDSKSKSDDVKAPIWKLSNVVFKNCEQKAIYAEALTESEITDCKFINCGKDPDAVYGMASAVDINLKYGNYENITIQDCYFEGNGAGLGGALLIKARDDGNYATPSATLTGVTITGCTFTGNNRDIVFGEPMKNNAGPTGVTINGVSVDPSTTTLPGEQTIGGAEVLDYRVAEGKTGLSFAGSTLGVVVEDANDFNLTFDKDTYGEAVTDFFCADCVSDPGSDHATHTTFATVNSDGSLQMEKASDGRLPDFRLNNVDLENNTYTISYDLNVKYTGESGGVLGVNTGNTGWGADAHFVLKQGEGLYSFANKNAALSEADVFKTGGKFHVKVTYTLGNDTPKTELTIRAGNEEKTITGQGGTDNKKIYWCGYTYENVSASVEDFTVTCAPNN